MNRDPFTPVPTPGGVLPSPPGGRASVFSGTFANQIAQRLPWLIAIVVVLAMVLLLVVFRSVTIAIKAAVMNLLSISAAYGVLVLVVQHGWLRQVFGFPEKMPVTTWVPMFLFGLSGRSGRRGLGRLGFRHGGAGGRGPRAPAIRPRRGGIRVTVGALPSR
jgi:hypothetical protein